MSVAVVKLFISSPGGLDSERAIVLDEIAALSEHQERSGFPGIAVTRWPDDIGGGRGEYGQLVINRQAADHDIFLCLVGARMGTPTPRANSGTEEEFDDAMEAKIKGKNVQILLFFWNHPVRPHSIDPYQLMLVKAFQEKAGRLGVLYHTANDDGELRRLVRTSLREAYNQVVNRAESHIAHPVRAAVSRTITIPDIEFVYQQTSPQAADVKLVPISEFRRNNIALNGVIVAMSEYMRFGFKYFDSREQLFSPGSIQTIGQNILVHIGRNKGNPIWFVTEYRGGYRVHSDKPLNWMTGNDSAQFALRISADGNIIFSINGVQIYAGFFPLSGLPGLALLGWGDENSDFRCLVHKLELSVDFGA